MLLLVAGWIACVVIVFTAFGASQQLIIFAMTSPAGWIMPADALFVPFMLLGFAAVVRRLHDIGMNALPVIGYILLYGTSIGCFHLLAHVHPKATGSNAQRAAELIPGLLLGLPGLLTFVGLVGLIVMCAQASAKGPNRYGPNARDGVGI